MRYLSVCSGIEATSAAFHPLGWEAVAFSEIEKFPSAVLAHHYPTVPNWGDMNHFQDWPHETIDLLAGGTPCQSFSVAGLRAGLNDPRGNLALIFLAIAERYRPSWILWENVPGVLSSGRGRDFGSLLGGLVKLGYGVGYRVLDAQFVRTRRFPRAIPQRRRRVFVVGYLGDWRPPAAVLFDAESLRGNPPPSRRAPQDFAGTLAAKSFTGGAGGRPEGAAGGHFRAVRSPVVANPLTRRMYKGINTTLDEGNTPIPVAFNWQNGGGYGKANDGLGIGEDHAGPISTSQVQAFAGADLAVRKLTPLECERLMGFPDGYTRIPWRGRPAEDCPDAPRYRALGNSIAVNCLEWIGERIALTEDLK